MSTPAARFQPLVPLIKTVRDRDNLLSQIEKFLQSIYTDQKGNLKTLLYFAFTQEVAEALFALLDGEKTTMLHKIELRTYLTELSEFLRQMPITSLTIAFLPNGATVEAFSQWTRTNLDPLTLIQTSVDEGLVAGALIEYKGIYKDLSLRAGVIRGVQARKQEFLKLLS